MINHGERFSPEENTFGKHTHIFSTTRLFQDADVRMYVCVDVYECVFVCVCLCMCLCVRLHDCVRYSLSANTLRSQWYRHVNAGLQPAIRHLVSLIIKAACELTKSEEVLILLVVVTASLCQDINSKIAAFRSNAISVLAKVLDVHIRLPHSLLATGCDLYLFKRVCFVFTPNGLVLASSSRIAHSGIIPRRPCLCKSTDCSSKRSSTRTRSPSRVRWCQGSQLFRLVPVAIRRWVNEVQESAHNQTNMTQFHALNLMYLMCFIRRHDKLAINRMVCVVACVACVCSGSRSVACGCVLYLYIFNYVTSTCTRAHMYNIAIVSNAI